IFCLVLQERTLAWEGDVHYVLTCWLATKAGFSDVDAEKIAQADLAQDEGWSRPATKAMPHALLTGDKGASEDTRERHFPVDKDLPSDPKDRAVLPGSDYAWKDARTIIAERPGETTLTRFGWALHRLQDSWAHQGVPDTPLRPAAPIHPELSWSHPRLRGGW